MWMHSVNRGSMDETAAQFGLLSRQRRLIALAVLRDSVEPLTPEELATEVGVRELDVPRSELTAGQRERILLTFHHAHLPKLAEADIVEYTPTGDRVRLADGAEDVRRILDVVFDD